MTYGLLLIMALFMRFGPDIPFRGMLNKHLVERPVEYLMDHERHHYIFLIIAPLMLLLGGEAILLFGPELMLAYAADIAIYVDVVVIAAAATSWSRAHSLLTRWRPRFGRNLAGRRTKGTAPRSKRTQRAPSRLTKANDDDGDRPDDAGFIAASQPCAMAA